MSPLGEELNREIELDSRLTSNEGPRGSARGSPGPSTAGLKARRPDRLTTSVVNLVVGSAAEPGVGAEAVVTGEVERHLLFERGEPEGNQDQTPRALGLDGSDVALDHRQAPVFPQRPETVSNALPTTPSPKSLCNKLTTLVRDEATRHLTSAPGRSLEKPPYRGRGRQRTINRESHDSPREVIDGNR